MTLFMRHPARIEDHTPFFLYHADTEEDTHESPTSLSKAWIGFNGPPACPQDQCWYKHKREKSNAPVCDQSKKLLVCTTSNIKIPEQGDTHRVKMKSKSQQLDCWRSSCWMAICLWDTWICHSLSNIEVCANASGNMSKHQPARKRLKKSTLAASTLTCCVFICRDLEQTRNTRPIGHFTMAGTLQVARVWGGWIRATTFEGTLQGGGWRVPQRAGGGRHEGEKGLKPPLKPPWSPSQAPVEALLKPFSSPLEAPPLKPPSPWSPPSSPSQAPLKPFSSPLEALLKPPWSPLRSLHRQAPLKPFWSPLEALLKPPWSPLEALLKPPWSPLQALEGFTKVKPSSSPLEALLKPLEAPLKPFSRPPWSRLEAS